MSYVAPSIMWRSACKGLGFMLLRRTKHHITRLHATRLEEPVGGPAITDLLKSPTFGNSVGSNLA